MVHRAALSVPKSFVECLFLAILYQSSFSRMFLTESASNYTRLVSVYNPFPFLKFLIPMAKPRWSHTASLKYITRFEFGTLSLQSFGPEHFLVENLFVVKIGTLISCLETPGHKFYQDCMEWLSAFIMHNIFPFFKFQKAQPFTRNSQICCI